MMMDINNLVRPNILNLKAYSSARDEYTGQEGIFLDANENPCGTLNRYPDPYQKELKNKLALLKKVTSDQVFIGNGSDEVIDLAFRIFCNPGEDYALTCSPTYGMYEVSAAINNITLLKFPLTEAFQIDVGRLSRYFDNPAIKLLFICSPNNPTGNLMALKDIEFVLQHFKGIVIIDEAYIDFAKADSTIKLLANHNNLIVSQTFSKAWGLAAARVGTAYANENIIALFNKVKPPYNVSKINQEAAIRALNNFQEFEIQLKELQMEKERLLFELRKCKLVKHIYPSDANFLLLKVNDADRLYKQLINHKIIVRNRSRLIPNTLRITIGTTEENNILLNTLNSLS